MHRTLKGTLWTSHPADRPRAARGHLSPTMSSGQTSPLCHSGIHSFMHRPIFSKHFRGACCMRPPARLVGNGRLGLLETRCRRPWLCHSSSIRTTQRDFLPHPCPPCLADLEGVGGVLVTGWLLPLNPSPFCAPRLPPPVSRAFLSLLILTSQDSPCSWMPPPAHQPPTAALLAAAGVSTVTSPLALCRLPSRRAPHPPPCILGGAVRRPGEEGPGSVLAWGTARPSLALSPFSRRNRPPETGKTQFLPNVTSCGSPEPLEKDRAHPRNCDRDPQLARCPLQSAL